MLKLIGDDRGLTLVEVVVAIALIALVVVSMFATVTQSSVFSRNIDIAYAASILAQRRIDFLRTLDFNQIPSGQETDIRIGADGLIDANGNYIRTTEMVTDYDGNPYLIKVKVSVKRVKVNIDGTVLDSQGRMSFLGQPVIMETLFADVE